MGTIVLILIVFGVFYWFSGHSSSRIMRREQHVVRHRQSVHRGPVRHGSQYTVYEDSSGGPGPYHRGGGHHYHSGHRGFSGGHHYHSGHHGFSGGHYGNGGPSFLGDVARIAGGVFAGNALFDAVDADNDGSIMDDVFGYEGGEGGCGGDGGGEGGCGGDDGGSDD